MKPKTSLLRLFTLALAVGGMTASGLVFFSANGLAQTNVPPSNNNPNNPSNNPLPSIPLPEKPIIIEPPVIQQPKFPENLDGPPQGSPKPGLEIDPGVTSGGVLSVNLSCRGAVGSLAQKLAACRSILGWQRRTGDRLGEIGTLTDIGRLLEGGDRGGLATVFLKQAVRQSQTLPLTAWQVGQRTLVVPDAHRYLANNLLSKGQINQGLAAIEALKTAELHAYMGEPPPPAPPTAPDFSAPLPSETTVVASYNSMADLGQKVEACKQTQCSDLSKLNDQLQKLVEEYNAQSDAYEKEIRQRRSEDDAFLDPRYLPKLREIVDAQPGTVLIYPLVMEDKIWLISVFGGGVVKSQEIAVKQQEVGQAVYELRRLIQDPTASTKAFQTASQKLYGWLLQPLKAEIQPDKVKNIVFALDRVTRYIPVSALFDGQKYLIENYTTSIVLSGELTDLRDRLPTSVQQTPVLAMGAAEFASYPPLPYVPAELDRIVQKPNSPGIYPGQEVLNQAFNFKALRDRLTGHRILHIATHGKFVSGQPKDSFLVLGSNEKMLISQVRSLQDLSNIHLVVLSACETAVGGPTQDGIEISGMSYYFMNSGAKAVMASLWSVDDASTSQLMGEFYRVLAKNQSSAPITKAEALRQAQLALLRGTAASTGDTRGIGVVATESKPGTDSPRSPGSNFAKPFYWAPFILIGNNL